MPVRNMRDCTVKIQDGNTVPQEIELLYSEGDLKYSIERYELQQILDRGKLSELKKGNEKPVTLSFSKKYDQMIAKNTDSAPSVFEALTGTGKASSWVSTNTSDCGMYTCRVIFEIYDECLGQTETTTFENFHLNKTDVSEAADVNKQAYDGIDWETEPTIAWS